MAEASEASDAVHTRVILGLPESDERGGKQPQRWLASKLGAAFRLANTCVRSCIKNGLVAPKLASQRFAGVSVVSDIDVMAPPPDGYWSPRCATPAQRCGMPLQNSVPNGISCWSSLVRSVRRGI